MSVDALGMATMLRVAQRSAGLVGVWCGIAAFASTALAAEPREERPERLTYELSIDPEAARIHVRLTWDTGAREQSTLHCLEQWASVSDVPARIKNVRCGEGATLHADRSEWRLEHAPGAPVRCEYDVECLRSLDWNTSYQPVVGSDYLHAIGTTFLIVPKLAEPDPARFEVTMRISAPAGWKPARCSWGAGEVMRGELKIDDLLQSVYVAGAFESRQLDVFGERVTVAARDRFAFGIDELASLASTIISTQRRFMRDDKFPPFLLTAVEVGEPASPRGSSMGGTGLYRSFALFLQPGAGLGGPVEHLISHELFHYWNGRVLQNEEPEELVYWFSEGVTEYYGLRLLRDSGMWSAKAYCDWINRHIRDYHANPANRATNEDIRQRFWSDRSTVGEVPYPRGLMLALRWHARARREGVEDGFDRLFRAMVERAGAKGERAGNTSIRAAGVELLGPWFGDEFDRFVMAGELVELPADALGEDIIGRETEVGTYDPGFDTKRSVTEKKLVDVRPGGPAERAGLREGDALAGMSIVGQPDIEASVDVQRDGERLSIRYFPRSAPIRLMQFSPRSGLLNAPETNETKSGG